MSEDQGRYYGPKFYREISGAQESAREVLPLVFEITKAKSVVDIGCGTGHWLAIAREFGAQEILGVDGEWARSQLVIPPESFLAHDLSQPLKLPRRFDLVLSLEVAEHLPASAAADFVRSLCDACDVVVFSAAIPGQGGRKHLNEQWPAYWADRFAQHGFDCYDTLRPKIWNNPRIAWYYAQNVLIFSRTDLGGRLGKPSRPLALVHPGLWSAQVAAMKRPGKLLERLVKAMLRKG
jgi:SAM-dependent methyltransferase